MLHATSQRTLAALLILQLAKSEPALVGGCRNHRLGFVM